MEASPLKPKRRLQFSLLNLLLLTAVVATFLAAWGVAHTNKQLQVRMATIAEENRRLRSEYGEFTVDDPTKIYAVQVLPAGLADSHEKLHWQWRVHIPEGKAMHLCFYSGTTPGTGFPKPHRVHALHAGTYIVGVRFFYDGRLGRPWQQVVEVDRGSYQAHLKDDPWPSLRPDPEGPLQEVWQIEGVRSESYSEPNLACQSPDTRLLLYRYRSRKAQKSAVGTMGVPIIGSQKADAPGFMLWIEPK